MNRLPVEEVIPDIVRALHEDCDVVLKAPTGAGKTTRVPVALLESGFAQSKTIVLLEPRRVAARSAARWIAKSLGVPIGHEVGYRVRFDNKSGPKTKLLVVTEGILVQMLQADPFLERVGTVVFDEFHERHLETDLAIAMVREVQASARPDLRLLVMSATLDIDQVAECLPNSRVIESAGRLHPVSIDYAEERNDQAVWTRVAIGVRRALRETDGDVLAFLPGVREIQRTAELLSGSEQSVLVLPLHGRLGPKEQDKALRLHSRRKVVLATNIAESSVTIAGVTAVVDSGLERQLRYDSGCALNRLELRPISRESADQRAGRAGRERPGRCFRLWTQGQHAELLEHNTPEIRRVDLTGLCLEVAAWGQLEVASFGWYETPPENALNDALALLRRLGAVTTSGLTKLGARMARLPVHPRLAACVLRAQQLGVADEAACAAAMLAGRPPFGRAPDSARADCMSDTLERVWEIENARPNRVHETRYGRLSGRAVAEIMKSKKQLLGRLPKHKSPPHLDDDTTVQAFNRALLAGYPDRVARRRKDNPGRAVLVDGRGVRLGPESGVREGELLVCVELAAGTRGRHTEALVRQAARVEADWLDPGLVEERSVIQFDDSVERVVSTVDTVYCDLVISSKPMVNPDRTEVSAVLAKAAAAEPERALDLLDSEYVSLVARLELLRPGTTADSWPAWGPNQLTDQLDALCANKRSFSETRKVKLSSYVRGRLPYEVTSRLDREAPTRYTFPNGSSVAIKYSLDGPPVLAGRIQQFFGVSETPTIARGRVKLLLHLLAPNMRPQQVTDDLTSFWDRTYSEVRKELRRRYPKHDWPEDPRTAVIRRRR